MTGQKWVEERKGVEFEEQEAEREDAEELRVANWKGTLFRFIFHLTDIPECPKELFDVVDFSAKPFRQADTIIAGITGS